MTNCWPSWGNEQKHSGLYVPVVMSIYVQNLVHGKYKFIGNEEGHIIVSSLDIEFVNDIVS